MVLGKAQDARCGELLAQSLARGAEAAAGRAGRGARQHSHNASGQSLRNGPKTGFRTMQHEGGRAGRWQSNCWLGHDGRSHRRRS